MLDDDMIFRASRRARAARHMMRYYIIRLHGESTPRSLIAIAYQVLHHTGNA